MFFFYKIGIRIYGILLRLAALWHPKAKDWVQGRKDWANRLKQQAPAKGYDLWMHCSSLGEFEQGRPVMDGFRKKYPDSHILLTFYSPSGYGIRKDYWASDYVMYLPLDTKANAQRFLRLANPALFILVKYDFWPNLLDVLRAQRRKAWLMAAKFHEQDQFHQWYGKWTRPYLAAFEKIFLQEGPKINWYPPAQQWIVGDPRVDRVSQIQQEAQIPAFLKDWKQQQVFAWGSVWKQDWPLIQAMIDGPLADWQHLIAPHQIDPNEIKALEAYLGRPMDRFTADKAAGQILVLDTIGHLSSAYGVGYLAYIGGGFGSGIHNILEPLAAGLPTFFGPRHHKFPEAVAAIQADCGFEVLDAQHMLTQINEMLQSGRLAEHQQAASAFITVRAGAATRILREI